MRIKNAKDMTWYLDIASQQHIRLRLAKVARIKTDMGLLYFSEYLLERRTCKRRSKH